MTASDKERYDRNFAKSLDLPDDTRIGVVFPTGEAGWLSLNTVRMVSKGAPEGHTSFGKLSMALATKAMISFKVKPREDESDGPEGSGASAPRTDSTPRCGSLPGRRASRDRPHG